MPTDTLNDPNGREADRWPALPFADWQATYETLHRWTQIVGKVKLELAPFLNELWHVALQLTARGLTTGPLPMARGVFEVRFDFLDHNLSIETSERGRKLLPLMPRSVADFYAEFMAALRSLGLAVRITPVPDEVPDQTAFPDDHLHATYDADQVERWWQAMLLVSKALEAHRSAFVGKSSPVQFFWGSFDLSLTRHSGRPATPPKGAPLFMRLAEDQEIIAAGFWPGNERLGGAALYSYTYPEPMGLKAVSLGPGRGYYDADLGEFVLRYEDIRQAEAPNAVMRDFLQQTYEAGATLGKWDRKALERSVPKVSKLAREGRQAT
ncbi:MAG: hypothetical protein JOZ17_11870 [Acetobacteraceae bacterium]|nr:hypothetical protein [Acetobacteraceae bacterium]